jgi:hypothetical protein
MMAGTERTARVYQAEMGFLFSIFRAFCQQVM